MKTIQIAKHEVKFYDSIKEMPIQRYNAMQGYLMQDSGIGSNMAAVEQHFRNLDAFLSAGKLSEAIQERQNLHINIYAALEKIDFKSMAFACMIYSIDGKCIGNSEEELKEATNKLIGLSVGQVVDILDELKKNCIGN